MPALRTGLGCIGGDAADFGLPDVISRDAAISACEKGLQGQQALLLGIDASDCCGA